ncbi:MAG: DUF374 domain-containing protein [Roseococcus sp.]|nr:DUF374 domain-containing protein [Roseococcus sp.]
MFRRLTRHPAVLAVATRLIGAYLAFVYRTARWELLGYDAAAERFRAEGRAILAFWHETLPLMPWLMLEVRRRGLAESAHVLVSSSRDGALIGRIVGRFGLRLAIGSSSRHGGSGLVQLARLLEAGEVVAITPDGPRGPRRQPAPGVAELAALSGAPVFPVGARMRPALGLSSWDRMELPLPFARAAMVIGPAIAVPPGGGGAALPAIAAALDAACDAADGRLGRTRRG